MVIQGAKMMKIDKNAHFRNERFPNLGPQI